jgi:ATP-dependent DNA helicase RecG
VEFKEAKRDFNFAGSSHADPKERRKCVLGYVVALANEGGGYLVFGIREKSPNEVVGTAFSEGKIGKLMDDIYLSAPNFLYLSGRKWNALILT